MEVKFTRLALADLVRIRAYIGAFNPAAAERMAARLLETSVLLDVNLMIGRPAVNGTREVTIVPPYIIVYRITGNHIRILRIWHGAQNR